MTPKKPAHPQFSSRTLKFIEKASRQKNPEWLEKNRTEYESSLQAPLQYLAQRLKLELGSFAPHYHFPQKGIGRIKYSAKAATERGGRIYKNWITYSAGRPRTSRFEHNPNLFFLINLDDPKDTILVAGGLYMPSSRQMRAIRESIAHDASPFERLFSSRDFARIFPGGFSKEKTSTRPPRGFDPDHPKMEWLKLQAFFVWRSYTRREFASADFNKLVSRDFKQVIRLNHLLENILRGAPGILIDPKSKTSKPTPLSDRLETVEGFGRKMDF